MIDEPKVKFIKNKVIKIIDYEKVPDSIYQKDLLNFQIDMNNIELSLESLAASINFLGKQNDR